MILQCDQCNTKFKLDDSKIKDGGVKVRCSKCKHVFVVTKKDQEEVADFDALLNTLGSSTPQPDAAAGSSDASSEVSAETKAQAPADDDFLNGISDTTNQPSGPHVDSTLEQQILAEAAKYEEESSPGSENGFDLSSFNFSDEPAADSPAPPVEEESPSEPESSGFDFSDLNLGTDTVAESPSPSADEVAPQQSGFDLGEFDFNAGDDPLPTPPANEKPSAGIEEQPEQNPFGEFDFNAEADLSENSASNTVSTAADAGAQGYDEFQFTEEPLPSAAAVEASAPAAGTGIDFGELTFGEESSDAPAAAKEDAAGVDAGFELGAFDFEMAGETAPEKQLEATTPEPAFLPDSSEDFFSTGDMAVAENKTDPPVTAEAMPFQAPAQDSPLTDDTGGFSFDFSDDEPLSSPSGESPSSTSSLADVPDSQELAEFSFSDSITAESKGITNPTGQEDENTFFDMSFTDASPSPADKATSEPVPDLSKSGADQKQAMDLDPQVSAPVFDEDLPPLSITSRRKGSAFLGIAGIAAALVGVLVLAGGGYVLLKKDPAIFNKAGLGSLASWVEKKTAEDGRIVVANPNGQFIVNKQAGEIFVITGEAVNQYKKPRASIQVKATLFGNKSTVIMQKAAYCGNRISKDQLESLPLEKLDAAMNNQFGDSLANLGVQPGKTIPFVVVFSNVPQGVVEFGVDIVGSTVASP